MAGRSARERAEREARKRTRSYTIRQQVHGDQVRRRRRDDVVALIAFLVVVGLATTAQVGFFTLGPGKPVAQATSSATATPTPTPTLSLPPKSLSQNRTWKATMTIGGAKLAMSLDGKKAPQAVANFLALIEEGYYANAYCPRLTTKALYVLQCGTKTNSAADAGPGYSFGPVENAPSDGRYTTGMLAMARGSSESSQSSQFFIVYKDSQLGGRYTVFGTVTSGLSALRTDVVADGVTASAKADGDGAPATPVRITAAAVSG